MSGSTIYSYVEGNPVSYTDPTGEIVFVPILVGIGVGLAFDYAVSKWKEEHCKCKDAGTPAGPAGNAAAGGAIGATGPFGSKPRTGIAGGGPSGSATSTVSQINHAAARQGMISIPTRNAITKIARKVPYVGMALMGYELYDAFTCD